MARIVIAGAGFAGIEAARVISRGLQLRGLKEKHTITIIDRNSYHTFTPALIPAATTPKTVSDEQIRNAVCIPLSDIHFFTPVEIVTDEIIRFDTAWNSVVGKKKHYEYDYLVIATGQEPTFFNIQGMKSHSFPLATIEHALTIRDELARQIQIHEADEAQIRVIGGGPAGVEFAGLLADRKYAFTKAINGRCSLSISILDAGDTLLRAFRKQTQNRVTKILQRMGIEIFFNTKINHVADGYIEFENQERMPFDLIIWNAGRIAPEIVGVLPFQHERANTIATNESGVPKISGATNNGRPVYAAGDTTYITSNIAWVAPNAIRGGNQVAQHILANIDFAERLSSEYKPKRFIAQNNSIFLLGKHNGVVSIPFYIPSRLGIYIRRIIDFRYFLHILTPICAWKKFRMMDVIYR